MTDALSKQWPVKRLRYLTSRSSSDSRRARLAQVSEASFLPMEAIGEQGQLDLSATRPIEKLKSGYSQFFDGDVVIAKITPCFENGKGALIRGTLGGVGFGTTELHVLTPGPELDGRFLYYVTVDPRFRQFGEAYMTGAAGQQRVPEDFVRDLQVPIPELSQQRTIADYLDRETARLDALVAAKERLLDLLAEKRRAIITRAVTRGLDPNVPLRDSGIPWLGEVPEHWEIKRLKHVGRAIIGLTFDPADTVTDGSGVLVLRASNVRDQKIVLEDNLFVLMDIPEILITRVGDILICSRSGSRALIGKNALIDQGAAGLTFGAFMTVFRSPHNEYLFYIFNSPLFDYQAGAFSTSTINQLTVETLNGMEIPLPPPSEQKAIVASLRGRTSCLDRLVEATDRTIALLKERRAALIAAAVTGRIGVESAT